MRLLATSAVVAAVSALASAAKKEAPTQLPNSNDPPIEASGPVLKGPYVMPSAPKYDYVQALHMSYLFYHGQISGKLDQHRLAWRDDSCFQCKGDFGEDLSGGWSEAANTMKWGQPFAWTAMQLTWNVFEFENTLAAVNELEEARFWVRHGASYMLNLYHNINDTEYVMGVHGISADETGDIDFGYYGPAEEYEMWVPHGTQRKAFYCVGSSTRSEGCSDIAAGYASALAAASVVLRSTDPSFADQCYAVAQNMYHFADKYRGSYNSLDSLGFKNMAEWYPSTSYIDELANAAVWLHLASLPKVTPSTLFGTTSNWLPVALKNYGALSADPKGNLGELSWDNTGCVASVLLFRITGQYSYMYDLRTQVFDVWLDVVPLTQVTQIQRTPRGLAWFELWGSLGYATAIGMIALVAARAVDAAIPHIPSANMTQAVSAGISSNYSTALKTYAVQQVNYALGDCGRSWVPGFGKGFPLSPYHKSSYNALIDYPMRKQPQDVVGQDFLYSKTVNRFTLYGALGGGPALDDSYYDDRQSYVYTEVTQDANAGYTGALMGLIELYSSTAFKNASDCQLDLGWTHKNASESTRRQKWPSGDCYHTCDPCANTSLNINTNGTTPGNGNSTSNGSPGGSVSNNGTKGGSSSSTTTLPGQGSSNDALMALGRRNLLYILVVAVLVLVPFV